MLETVTLWNSADQKLDIYWIIMKNINIVIHMHLHTSVRKKMEY